MSGVLYIVATPIGNLDDITLRAIETLRQVDLIAAEDTRHSQHLLSHFGIKNNLLSVHEHNERERISTIVDHLAGGESVALISDAGTPLISDPGYPLLRGVIEAGYKVVPIPGVSSIVTALSAAGLPTDQFCYHGFLSHKNAERMTTLENLKQKPGTHIFLESTHRIERLLEQIDQLFPELMLVLAKELTKRHENFIRGTAAQCQQEFGKDRALVKGEFVMLIHLPQTAGSELNRLATTDLLETLLQDLPLKKAVKLAVKITGERKNTLYQAALELSDKKAGETQAD